MADAVHVGAVMYDPKVSVIWEIIRDFFDAQEAPIDVAYEFIGRALCGMEVF